jgi:hypothetical protein
VLDIDLAVLVAGEGQVEALQDAPGAPGLDLVAVEVVVGRRALAEHQPVAMTAGGGAGLQVGAQAGQPRAVADQDQRPVVRGRVEGAVVPHARGDLGPDGGVQGQPA